MSSQQRVKSASGTSRPGSRGHVRPGSRGAVSVGNHGNHKEMVSNQRKVVGQYMLGKTIGEGTFGKVKLAIHLPTGEKVNKTFNISCIYILFILLLGCCKNIRKESY
jgi:hypothetical protein